MCTREKGNQFTNEIILFCIITCPGQIQTLMANRLEQREGSLNFILIITNFILNLLMSIRGYFVL